MKKLLPLLFLLLGLGSAVAATLLPNGEQQFFNIDGTPLSGGSVYTYIPGTTTPKSTWSNSGQTVLNANPIPLNQGGFATIYGSGSYREIVKDSLGNTVFDAVTADTSATNTSWSGVAGGTANAIVLTASAFTAQDGQTVSFIAQYDNTGATTVTIGGNVYQVTEPGPAGAISLQGGEIEVGAVVNITYLASTGAFQITNPDGNNQFLTVPASATTDIGSTSYTNVNVSGSATITSFGTSASIYFPLYFVTFSGNSTIAYNVSSLITPNAQNIYTQPGTTLTLQYLGSGNWKVVGVSGAILPGLTLANPQTVTTYTIQQSDQGKVDIFSNSGAIAVTIPQAIAPFDNGFFVDILNAGTGTVTLTPTTSTIAGNSFYTLPSQTSARLVSDGVNWNIIALSSQPAMPLLLGSQVASNVGALQDTTSFPLGYRHYKIKFNNISPVTNASTCEIQVQFSGTFQTSGYSSVDMGISGTSSAVEAPTTYIPCSYSSAASNATPQINGECLVDNPALTGNYVPFTCSFTNSNAGSGAVTRLTSSGWFASVGAIAGYKILFSSGNIGAGNIQIYAWE